MNKVKFSFWDVFVLLSLAVIFLLGLYAAGCTGVIDPTGDMTITPNYTTDPPETEVVPTPTPVLIQPKRYIDYQAEVVCYYIPNSDISCIPGNQTKIFTYDLRE